MEDNKTNGHKDVLLDRRQLDQVMKAINKQISHAQYEYKDSGALQVEMDELFSYEEINTLLPRLVANRQASLLQMKAIELDIWIEQLLDQLESGYEQRIQAAQGLLYIALGDFDQWINDRKKHLDTIIKNNALLFDRGVFHSVHQVLKRACNQLSSSNNKPIDNNKNLLFEIDLYLTINYLIIESNRQQGRFENDQDLLEMDILKYLFLMLARLKDGFMQSFPMKKLLLLISKVLLATLGNIQNTKDMKNEARRRHGLPIKRKTPIIKCSHRDLYTFQNDLASRYPTYTPSNIESTIFSNISPLTIKASSALATAMGISNATKQTTLPYQVLFPPKQPKSNNDNNKQANNPGVQGNTGLASDDPWHSSQTVVLPLLETGPSLPVGLKEANATYQQHLEISLADYQILMERQRAIQKWQELEKERTTYSNDQIRLSSSERTTTTTPMDEGQDSIKDKFDIIEQFYASIAPELQGIVIVLLKQLLTTATAKSKPTSKNNGQQLYQDGKQIKETTSMDRHREVLCKSISAILLLLLKWFKISHVLKFEYLSQLLVDSGCMLLILKIFGLQEIGTLASIKTDADEYGLFRQMESLQPQSNGIAATSNGSSYVSPPLSPSSESHYTNERNLFWIINLLHVLQMLSRDKVHRIMLLVQYKSSAIFKRVLKISHPVVELYALKNLKNQIPYLGRKWRSSNMKIISSIYFRCPPDFRDDWLITRNDKEGDLEEGKAEEINLRMLIRLYNGQRYLSRLLPEDDSALYDPINGNDIPFSTSLVLEKGHDLDSSAMFDENDLDDTFKKDYSQWLETEVYSKKNQWKYGKDNHDDDDDEYLDNYHKQKANTTNWPGTPIPASPICRPLDNAGISPTVLAQEINKLYHEELNREFDMNGSMNGKETKIKDEWDAPTIPTNYMGEFIYTNNNNDDDDLYPGDDDDDDDDYDDDKKSTRWLTDPLVDVNWTTLTEDEFAKRLAIVEEKTVRRWMNVDINDPQYIKVLDTFEKSEESGYDEWDTTDPSLET